jgi:hypothetical protein
MPVNYTISVLRPFAFNASELVDVANSGAPLHTLCLHLDLYLSFLVVIYPLLPFSIQSNLI